MEFTKQYKGAIENVDVFEYCMKNQELEVRFLNIGGAITKIAMACDDFNQNLIVNYDKIEDYFNNNCYLNVLVGRTANRIKEGHFELAGKSYTVDLNDNVNNLHGGVECLSSMIFTVKQETDCYCLECTLPHQQIGFPGNLKVIVRYQLEGNMLKIIYEAYTDQETLVNLTHHAYFNLSGNLKNTIYNHKLQIFADEIAIVDENSSFTGESIFVNETLFDFNQRTIINPKLKMPHQLLLLTSGYDHLYLLEDRLEVANVVDPESKRKLIVETDYPALQFYAGNYMTNELSLENGRVGEPHLGFCLEAHKVPYNFKDLILKPGEKYINYVGYRFTKEIN